MTTLVSYEDRKNYRGAIMQMGKMIERVEAVGRGERVLTADHAHTLQAVTGEVELTSQHRALKDLQALLKSEYDDRLVFTARTDLSAFAEVVTPHEFPAKHHMFMVDRLHALVRGDVKRMMLSMPPGHAKDLDVETMVLMGDGVYQRLGDIRVGDMVITKEGRAREVLAVHDQGVRPVVRVVTKLGRVIRAHPDHLFLTPTDWIKAGELKRGDRLALLREFEIPDTSGRTFDEFALAGYLCAASFANGRAYSRIFKISNKFRCDDTVVLDDVDALARRIGFRTRRVSAFRASTVRTVVFDEAPFTAWLAATGLLGLHRHTLRIPGWVFRGSPQKIGAFIGAILSCDATFVPKRSLVTGAPCRMVMRIRNLGALTDIQSLLQRLGVRSSSATTIHSNYNFSAVEFAYLRIEDAADQYLLSRRIRVVGRAAALWNPDFRVETFAAVSGAVPYVEDSVEHLAPDGFAETRCLTVDEDHSFLARDIVVHNSTYASRYLGAWWLGKQEIPNRTLLLCGHTVRFVRSEFGYKTRRIVEQPEYRRVFPHATINADINAQDHWALSNGPDAYFKAVGEAINGFRAHLASIDDPFPDSKSAESEAERDKVWRWFTADFGARPLPDAPILMTNTRYHVDDLNGRIINLVKKGEIEPWEIINLEAICEDSENDPLKRNHGEALWNEVFPLKFLQHQKAVLSTKSWGALYMGQPQPEDGELFDKAWFSYFEVPPADDVNNPDPALRKRVRRKIVSIDCANKQTQRSDFSVIMTLVETLDRRIYVTNIIRKRMKFDELEATINATAASEGASAIVIENQAAGIQYIQLNQDKSLIPVHAVSTNNNSKSMRADAITPDMKAGRILFPKNAPWLAEFERELLEFPGGKHDDQVDALSQGVAWLRQVGNRKYGSKKAVGP